MNKKKLLYDPFLLIEHLPAAPPPPLFIRNKNKGGGGSSTTSTRDCAQILI